MIADAFLNDDRRNIPLAASRAIRMLIAVSRPVLWVTLVFAFVWLSMRPTRRWIVRAFENRKVVGGSRAEALWRAAGEVLTRGPYLILAMLLIGALLGLLLGGYAGVMWGLIAAVLGASLAPVIFEPGSAEGIHD